MNVPEDSKFLIEHNYFKFFFFAKCQQGGYIVNLLRKPENQTLFSSIFFIILTVNNFRKLVSLKFANFEEHISKFSYISVLCSAW